MSTSNETESAQIESLAHKLCDEAMEQAKTISSRDGSGTRRHVDFHEEAEIVHIGPAENGIDTSEADRLSEDHLGEETTGVVRRVKVSSDDEEPRRNSLNAGIEDPRAVREALSSTDDEATSDQQTRENTRRNSLVHGGAILHREKDEEPTAEDEHQSKRDKSKRASKISTLPGLLKGKINKAIDSARHTNQKNKELKEVQVQRSATLRFPSASRLSERFRDARSTMTRSMSLRVSGSRRNPAEEAIQEQTVHRQARAPAAVDDTASLDTVSVETDQALEDHINPQESVLRRPHLPAIVQASMQRKKIPPPRPAEGPVLSPLDSNPFVFSDEPQPTSPRPSQNGTGQPRRLTVNHKSLTIDISAQNGATPPDSELDVNDLNPTQFDHTANYEMGSLSRTKPAKLYRNKSDVEYMQSYRNKHLDHVDRQRRKMASKMEKQQSVDTLKLVKAPKQFGAYERQEVFDFSFGRNKRPTLSRRQTVLTDSSSAVQSRRATTRLRETLKFGLDPNSLRYGGTLDLRSCPQSRTSTLNRSSTLGRPRRPSFSPQMKRYNELCDENKAPGLETPVFARHLLDHPPEDQKQSWEAASKACFTFASKLGSPTGDKVSLPQAKVDDCMEAFDTFAISCRGQKGPTFPWRPSRAGLNNCLGKVDAWPGVLVMTSSGPDSIDYLRLPQNKESRIIFPICGVENLLGSWLEAGNPFDLVSPIEHEVELFHGLSALDTLQSFLSVEAGLCTVARHCLGLAVLLSANSCSNRIYKERRIELNPSKILVCCTTTNCLVVFNIADEMSDHQAYESTINSLCRDLGLQGEYHEFSTAITALIERLVADLTLWLEKNSENTLTRQLMLSISPPDWTAQLLAKLGNKRLAA